MWTRAGVPLIVMAVCGRQKCEVYAFVTSRMVEDDGKWSESTLLLGCWVGERKRTLVELGGRKMGWLGLNVIEYGKAARWKQERWYMVSSASW